MQQQLLLREHCTVTDLTVRSAAYIMYTYTNMYLIMTVILLCAVRRSMEFAGSALGQMSMEERQTHVVWLLKLVARMVSYQQIRSLRPMLTSAMQATSPTRSVNHSTTKQLPISFAAAL
jgi:DIE2/ALG10 family